MPTIVVTRSIQASAQRVFDACRSVDVHIASGQGISALAVGGRRTGLSEFGDRTVWSARFFGLSSCMTTEIQHSVPPYELDDVMVTGYLSSFGHKYRIYESQDRGEWVTLTDKFYFEVPKGRIASLFERLLLTRAMKKALYERMDGLKKAAESEEAIE